MAITSPNDIAGLVCWYDAQDNATITLTGDDVTGWADKSASGYDLVGTTGMKIDTRTHNNNQVMDQTLGNRAASSTHTVIPQPGTTFIIGGWDADTLNAWLWRGGSNGEIGIRKNNDGSVTTEGFGGSFGGAAGLSLASYEWVIFANGATSSLEVDGVAYSSGALDPTRGINRASQVGQSLDGWIGEIVQYDTILSVGDIADVRAYLLDHWADTAVSVFMGPSTGFDKLDMGTTNIPAASVLSYFDGSHDGAGNAATLTDTGASWTVNELIGLIAVNVTDGSEGTITANTATTVTATLAGGSENDWDIGDSYIIRAAFDVGYQVAFETTANHSLGHTGIVTMDEFAVPTITGTSLPGIWTFQYRIKDNNGDNSVLYTVTRTET